MIGNLEWIKMRRIVVTVMALIGCVVSGCSGTSDHSEVKTGPSNSQTPENQSVDGSNAVITSKTAGGIQTDDVPKSLPKTDQLVGPAVVSCSFAQLVDLCYDWIHSPVKYIDTTLRLPALVLVGAR